MLPWLSSYSNTKSGAWFVKTVVKSSLIKGAGLGRFANENIPKGSIICKYKKIQISDIINIQDNYINSSLLFSKNNLLCFKDINDIESLIYAYFELCDERPKLSDIKYGLEHFLAAWNNIDNKNNELVLFNHSLCTNFGANITNIDIVNSKCLLKDTHFVLYSLKDIKKDDELFIDYNEFKFPKYYHLICNKFNMKPMTHCINEIMKLKQKKQLI